MTNAEMRRKRAEKIATARKLLEKATEEKRDLSAEEDAQYASIIDEAEQLNTQIKNAERLEAIEKEVADGERSQGTVVGRPEGDVDSEDRASYFASDEYRNFFATWLKHGSVALSENVRNQIQREIRGLQMNLDVSGGYLVTPIQMVQGLLKAMDNTVFIRQYATKYQVPTAVSMGTVSLDSDPDDAEWTSELKTGSETEIGFGKRELTPHPMAKRVKISNKLLRAASGDPEGIVTGRLLYKFGITEEKAFMTGTGSQQPLGVFVASPDGIPTSRDMSTDNTTTAITVDGLINAKYALKPAYWSNARWAFHTDAVKMLTKIKDGNGQYIWRENVRAGEPDTILGLPVDVSEYVPNTFTSGSYVGILADWRYYWIADALNVVIQRLVELYAESNQVGLIARKETDGMPVLGEAFVRVKLA